MDLRKKCTARFLTILLMLPLISVFLNGCGTVAGTSVTSEVNRSFSIDRYTRYFINAEKNKVCYKPVVQVLTDQGIIPYSGKVKTSKLEVYISDQEGICFPPRWNSDSLFFLRFTFPKETSVVFKDAVTGKVLLKVEYNRAFFAVNAGYKECMNMIRNELEKEISKVEKRNLPVPLKEDTGSYSGE